ncbi:Arc family DNA-binding protein [Aurantimonas coralicida]|nr:Arc family DNA-binding protein [Aurantimonas coralicida]MCD1645280.1 Arc family DNA-binding protein [Aurantimonas coralicida]
MAKRKLAREQDKFMLRLPDGMRQRLAEIATANERSMNAEIIDRLRQSSDLTAEDERLARIEAKLDQLLNSNPTDRSA